MTSRPYRLFWGETHDNTYQFPNHRAGHQPPRIAVSLQRAASHLDFYAAAYYTAEAAAFREGGHLSQQPDGPHQLVLEGWKPRHRIEEEWAEVQEITRAMNKAGRFVTFPGYEWQGDGSSGDHNVIALREGLPVFRVNTVAELYERLRGRKAIAIPHHTAYRPGRRGRDWSVFDERLSPFAEVYSIHGCSETDEEWVGMRHNDHMGPNVGAGTWQAALDRGLHVGAICSTDNWGDMPGCYGHGRMACLATELTREALWDAFINRRVYGVTGDRIVLDFRVNDGIMGEVIECSEARRIRVKVTGSDALDRIEILRNGRVIATHCHQGTWDIPPAGRRARFKLRVEAGWGPRPNELDVPDRRWEGELTVEGGRMLGAEPCWISPGQTRPVLDGQRATFGFVSSQRHVRERWQNADVFEFEADPAALLRLRMNGLEECARVSEFASASREMWFKQECVRLLRERADIPSGAPERDDIYHHLAYKVKVHRAIPERGYTAEFSIIDDEPFDGEIHYRVRVEQRNAQRAWSSPIWVRRA